MKMKEAPKIPLLELKGAASAMLCLEEAGFCAVTVRDSDPLFLKAGEKMVLQEEFSEKKYLVTLVASHSVKANSRCFIVRSCPEYLPPGSVLKNRTERLHNYAVENNLIGSPFYSMHF